MYIYLEYKKSLQLTDKQYKKELYKFQTPY